MVAILTLMGTVGQPVWAFDTFWHSAATGAATREFHFSADATNIVQFGNFSGPDFFGPLYEGMAKLEAALRGDNLKEFTTLRDSQVRHLPAFRQPARHAEPQLEVQPHLCQLADKHATDNQHSVLRRATERRQQKDGDSDDLGRFASRRSGLL